MKDFDTTPIMIEQRELWHIRHDSHAIWTGSLVRRDEVETSTKLVPDIIQCLGERATYRSVGNTLVPCTDGNGAGSDSLEALQHEFAALAMQRVQSSAGREKTKRVCTCRSLLRRISSQLVASWGTSSQMPAPDSCPNLKRGTTSRLRHHQLRSQEPCQVRT